MVMVVQPHGASNCNGSCRWPVCGVVVVVWLWRLVWFGCGGEAVVVWLW